VILSINTDYAGWVREARSGPLLSPAATRARLEAGLVAVLERLKVAGLRVVVIRDTPQTWRDIGDCLANAGGAACDRPRVQAVAERGPDVEAVRAVPGVGLADLTDRICDGAVCPARRDGLIVYRDRHHLSLAFAASLADDFRTLFPPAPAQVAEVSVIAR